VDVTVDLLPNAARVEERYALAPSGAPISLQYLTRPCATIANLRIEQAGSPLSVTESRNGPWVTFQARVADQNDSLRLLVRYDVQLTGTGVIPLVHLASAVTGTGSARTGPVKVLVRAPEAGTQVSFPHMTRQAPNEWSASFVAVPSFVELGGPRVTPCNAGATSRGDNGGLVWRFVVLGGIMAAWVPLYLAWARRSSEREQT
jgi:hypothetical protein